jgi:hypothetical protein
VAGLDSKPNVLLIGDAHSVEFVPVVRCVRQAVGDRAERIAKDVSELRHAKPAADSEPDVIVVLQAWPDQYSVADVNQLIAQFPLARLVCCYGPWCDSDGRNRSIWPMAVRVPAASFSARFARELNLAAALPLTASRSEIFEYDFNCDTARFSATLTAAVLSPDRRWREMICAALEIRGARLVPEGESPTVDLVLFDADPWDARRASQLSALRQAHRTATLIVCAGFPRGDLEAAIREAGADHVWFKLDSLASLTDRLVAAVEKA